MALCLVFSRECLLEYLLYHLLQYLVKQLLKHPLSHLPGRYITPEILSSE